MKEFLIKYKFVITTILVIIIISTIGIFIDFKFETPQYSATKVTDEEIIKEIQENIIIKEEISIEINTSLPSIISFIENSDIINDKDIEMTLNYKKDEENITPNISKIGEYSVVLTIAGNTYNSRLKIVDTTPPVVKLKNIAIYENGKYTIDNFIESYEDNSGSSKYTVNYINETDANITNAGTYYIKLNFCDESNNCKDEIATLVINKQSSNKPNQNSKPNNNSQQENKPDENTNKPIEQPTVVTKREILNSVYYNYGVRKITYQDVKYNNVNGELIEISRTNKKTEITYDEFNGTVESMKSEAESIYNITEEARKIILKYTNEYRTEAGVAPLTIDRTLSTLANIKAIEMAYSNKFDHVRPDGSSWDTLHKTFYKLNGLDIPNKRGENLATGYDDEEMVCDVWKNSPKHYENIVDDEFKRVGVGKYSFNGKTYWVQIFAS